MKYFSMIFLLLGVFTIGANANLKSFHPINAEPVESKEGEDRRLFGAGGQLHYIKEYLASLSNKGKYENLQPLIDSLRSDVANLLALLQGLLGSNNLLSLQGVSKLAAAKALCTTLWGTGTGTFSGNYFVSTTAGDWEAAQNACTARGMILVSIESGAENAVVEGVIANIVGTTTFWIGLYNSQSATNAYSFTATGFVPTAFSDWESNPPPNTANQCVEMVRLVSGNIVWRPVACASSAPGFICEKTDPCLSLVG